MKTKLWLSVLIFMTVPGLDYLPAKAQTPTPDPLPYINVTKEILNSGEIHVGDLLNVQITLTGMGQAPRGPADIVTVLDRSSSMAWGPQCGWNPAVEPPYGPVGVPPYHEATNDHPFVDMLWAAWQFYRYVAINYPDYGYEDYGGLVFFGSATGGCPEGEPPGCYPVPTEFPPDGLPEPVQRGDLPGVTPTMAKDFWWFEHICREPAGGYTALGPGMEIGRDMFAAMPTHPAAPTPLPGTPTPATPPPPVEGDRHMVIFTDGRPDEWWPPDGELPGWDDAYSHTVEMARRLALNEPWGPYTEVYRTTIHVIGLGSVVDHALMRELADPWHWQYWGSTPTPLAANHGEYHWAGSENDLDNIFQEIAAGIILQLAGTDISVREVMSAENNRLCPDGCTYVYTEMMEYSWNIEPTIIPPDPPGECCPEYEWQFDSLEVGEEIILTFQLLVSMDAPQETLLPYIECPESYLRYTNYEGTEITVPIPDPGVFISPGYPSTATPSPGPLVPATSFPGLLIGLIVLSLFLALGAIHFRVGWDR